MTANRNHQCLTCGDRYHVCSSCDVPSWMWNYCSEKCWSSSQKGMMCLALGDKLGQTLNVHELKLLEHGIMEESHYLDKILEGIKLPKQGEE